MKKNNIFFVAGFVLVLTALFFGCVRKYAYSFENGYNNETLKDTIDYIVDSSNLLIDRSKYIEAAIFPGLISLDEPRLNNYTVDIDLNYVEVNGSDLRISVAPGNWISTGLWAPAGELVTIKVPDDVFGLTVQIGSQTDNLTGKTDLKRDPVIFNRKQLYPGENKVRNLYGGLIYILPPRPFGRIVPIVFSNVAKSASFFLGKTTDAEWQQLLHTTTVPFFELVGKRIVFTLETSKMKANPIPSPNSLMQLWDSTIKVAYWDWTGMIEGNPDVKHRAPFNQWRIVHDVQPSAGAQHSGFPVVAMNTLNYFTQAVTVDNVKNSNWGTYHELGHNMQQGSTWSFNGNGEVTNNLFNFKVANMYGLQHGNMLRSWNAAKGYVALDSNAKRWTGTATWPGSSTAVTNPTDDAKMSFYTQIFEKYGYGFMTYLYTAARNARFTSIDDQSKIDFYYERLCEYTGIDMYRFMREWGLAISATSRKKIADGSYPLLNKDVWNYDPYNHTGGTNSFYVLHSRSVWVLDSVTNVRSPLATYTPYNVLDGNAATIWSSCFNGCEAGYPSNTAGLYPFIMQFSVGPNPITAGGFFFQQRQNTQSTHPNAITVEVTNDRNGAWTTVGTFSLLYGDLTAATLATQYFQFPQAYTFQYIRFKWNIPPGEAATNKNSAFAEVGTFY
jgi:hypothetical protein